MNAFVNQILPTILTALGAVVTAAITAAGSALVKYINRKREDVENKIGADAYNQRLSVAKEVWGVVDELFRTTPGIVKTIEAKQKAFAAELEKRIPGLTAEEIEQLRQTVAGIVNAGRDAITGTTTAAATPAAAPATTSAGSTTAAQ